MGYEPGSTEAADLSYQKPRILPGGNRVTLLLKRCFFNK